MNKHYDACVFDLDGTLADSLNDLAASCDEALSLFELPTHSIEEYRFFVGNGIRNLVCSAMGEKSEDEKLQRSVFETFNIIYDERCLEQTRPYSGIVQMLGELKESGVIIGVLSNKADAFAKRIVDALFDKGLIDIVYGQRSDYPRKPAPDSLYALLDQINCEKSKCLYIGDSNVDVATAKNAGVDFCGVEWGFRGYNELKNSGAEVIVKDPSEITEMVLQSYEQDKLSKGA